MEIEDGFPIHYHNGVKKENTIELPVFVERRVEAFKLFFEKEIDSVFSGFQGQGTDPIVSAKYFFVQCWESSDNEQDWEESVRLLKTNTSISSSNKMQEEDQVQLWETIHYDITEPLALEFRKSKAKMAKSIVTFVKMVAAAGFLAGVAYSLYLYGVNLSF